MKKKDRKEFYFAVLVFLALITMADIAVIKILVNKGKYTLDLNGATFEIIGVAENTNTKDNKPYYYPIYQRINK